MVWPTTPAVGDMYTTLGGTKFVYTAQGTWKAAPTTGTTTDASGLLTGTLNDARLPVGLHALTSDSVVTDLNAAKSTGNFSFGPTAANAPFANYGQLEVFARDANNLTQIAYKSGNARYIRDCTGGVFGSWVPLYGTATEIVAAMDGKCLPQTIMAPGSSGGSRRYMRLASVNGLSATTGAAMTFLMANAGDYDTPRRGTAIIHFTERADTPNVQVFQLDYENIQEGPIFYTVRTATYQFELWALFADYNHPINMYPLSTFNGTILGDSQTTTAPANLLTTYVFQNNIWHGGNFNPATKANLASPTFTGVPAAPTATAGTNTTQIATTAFVTTAIASVSGGAPASHTHVIADVTGLQTALNGKQGDLTYIRNLELAGSLSGDGHTYIDLHASSSVDYSARVLREGGVNGSLFIQNSGTGYIVIDGNPYFAGGVGVGGVWPAGSFKNSACIALGDDDTGIRQNGDGVLELWANNVNRATITSTGMALTGTPTAPTATAGTNTTQIATTEFVAAAVAAVPVGGSTMTRTAKQTLNGQTSISFTSLPTTVSRLRLHVIGYTATVYAFATLKMLNSGGEITSGYYGATGGSGSDSVFTNSITNCWYISSFKHPNNAHTSVVDLTKTTDNEWTLMSVSNVLLSAGYSITTGGLVLSDVTGLKLGLTGGNYDGGFAFLEYA